MINYPELISIPVAGCPIPPASYVFNSNLVFNELWLPVNGNLQVYVIFAFRLKSSGIMKICINFFFFFSERHVQHAI